MQVQNCASINLTMEITGEDMHVDLIRKRYTINEDTDLTLSFINPEYTSEPHTQTGMSQPSTYKN